MTQLAVREDGQLIQFQNEDGSLTDLMLPLGIYRSFKHLKRAADYAWRLQGFELYLDEEKHRLYGVRKVMKVRRKNAAAP